MIFDPVEHCHAAACVEGAGVACRVDGFATPVMGTVLRVLEAAADGGGAAAAAGAVAGAGLDDKVAAAERGAGQRVLEVMTTGKQVLRVLSTDAFATNALVIGADGGAPAAPAAAADALAAKRGAAPADKRKRAALAGADATTHPLSCLVTLPRKRRYRVGDVVCVKPRGGGLEVEGRIIGIEWLASDRAGGGMEPRFKIRSWAAATLRDVKHEELTASQMYTSLRRDEWEEEDSESSPRGALTRAAGAIPRAPQAFVVVPGHAAHCDEEDDEEDDLDQVLLDDADEDDGGMGQLEPRKAVDAVWPWDKGSE